MNPIKTFAVVLCATILWATGAEAQKWNRCDPRYYFITPSDCTTYGEQAAKAMAEMRVAIGEENAAIAVARKRFWETYPDKPGATAARDEFGKRLDGKDSYYLWMILTDAMGGAKYADLIGGKLDGGIPRYASYEFKDWVEEIKLRLGEQSMSQSMLLNPVGLAERLKKAMAASEKKRDVYLFERNWAEFDAVGREPAGLDDPAMYFMAICIRGQKIGWEDALTEFDGITKALGKDNVLAAIQQVHAAPRERFGVLKVTMPPPVKRSPGGTEIEDPDIPLPENVIGVTGSAVRAVERLASQGDDRRYLLWLLTDNNRRGSELVHETKWQHAMSAYQRLVLAFGEQDVLQAARAVRTAVKRATDSRVMNSSAIGATREIPLTSFEDVLARKNPRGYLRAAIVYSENLDSSVALDASYKNLVSTGNENAYLEAAKKLAAGRPNLMYKGELESMKEMLNALPDSEEPAVALVDYPPYLAWKKFAPGAKIVHAQRYWQVPRGGGPAVPGPVNYLRGFQLQAITPDQAKFWFSETMFDRNGRAKPPSVREEGYPAKFTPPPGYVADDPLAPSGNLEWGAEPASAPIASGEETIEINGKSFATRWQAKSYTYNETASNKGCSLVVKVWTNESVPTGLVKKLDDVTCPKPSFGQVPRFMIETYLNSFEGFTPVASR
jgi:hypothetical protein